MLTYEQWMGAISHEAAQGVFAEFEGAKNRNVCVDMVRWIVATGRAWRTKDGFHLVRGSVKHRPDGLKEDPFLKSIGITAAKIRGFLKQCLNRGIIEILSAPNEADESGRFWRLNRNGRPRNPPVVYRFTKSFLEILRRGHNAKESGSKVALHPLTEPLSSLPEVAPNAPQDYQDLEEGSGGYLASSPNPVAPVAGPKLTISQRAMQRFKPPRIPLPVIQQPAPTKPTTPSAPLTGSLAAALANLKSVVLGATKTAVQAPVVIPTESPEEADDRRFNERFPYQLHVTPLNWPQVFDKQGNLGIEMEVSRWLLEHAGDPMTGHGVRWMQQPDVPMVLRRAGLSPRDLFRDYGITRDMRIGFADERHKVLFSLRFGGVELHPEPDGRG